MPKIIILPGDGIGAEIVPPAVAVIKAVAQKHKYQFEFEEALIGGAAYDQTGHPLPPATIDLCKNSEAVLLGAVGGDKWDNLPVHLRPEVGALLPLRKALGLYANLRPVQVFSVLADASTLKPAVVAGLDLLIVRELTGGLYFGEKKKEAIDGGYRVVDTLVYTTPEIDRVAKLAFELASKRGGKLMSVDKANVLESSRHWRERFISLAKEYPAVALSHMYVDNCAMQLVRDPQQFDVMVTENMFGDILSDLAAQLTGSIGMLPSASIGGQVSLYEPIHGSAPDIAGQDLANPLATILSAAMMLRLSFNLETAAKTIEQAVAAVLADSYRTGDIMQAGRQQVGTKEMGELVLARL